MPAVFSAPVETLPEVAPEVEKPVPVQEVALVEFQESIEACPWSTVLGDADSVAVGIKELQLAGLLAPLTQESEPSGSLGLPPAPVHPPLLQAIQEPPL